MVPFASVDEIEARFRPLTESEAVVAEQLLEDASLWLMKNTRCCDERILSLAACEMARHGLEARGNSFSISDPIIGENAWTDAAPAGDMWLSRGTRQLLGLGQRISSVVIEP